MIKEIDKALRLTQTTINRETFFFLIKDYSQRMIKNEQNISP